MAIWSYSRSIKHDAKLHLNKGEVIMYTDHIELQIYRQGLSKEDQDRTVQLLQKMNQAVGMESNIGMSSAFLTMFYVFAMMFASLHINTNMTWTIFFLMLLGCIPVNLLGKLICRKYIFGKKVKGLKDDFAYLFENDRRMHDSLQIIKDHGKRTAKHVKKYLPGHYRV
ncbi:hypothetical protein HOB10_04555 [Candidatus Parcubacteria bacterium]|jgi:hypothetical protein|nr:hypothetical protein [Candidatus Parcubacteria bacterium]